ncbi:dCTP deaminase [bacterium]|nr:dCTP deaminase [bacterium]MCI0566077.1 dCTP deaminase [bacterium]
MILTHDVILDEIEKKNIIIDPLDKTLVGPASIDLRLGNLFRTFKKQSSVFLITEDSQYEMVTDLLEIKDGEQVILKPGDTILGVTQEKITISPSIAAWIQGRSRFVRLGLGVHIVSGFVQPGVSNFQMLEITNLSPSSLSIYPGLRICQLVFERCEGEATYGGKFTL